MALNILVLNGQNPSLLGSRQWGICGPIALAGNEGDRAALDPASA